jgi:hypothetical protein
VVSAVILGASGVLIGTIATSVSKQLSENNPENSPALFYIGGTLMCFFSSICVSRIVFRQTKVMNQLSFSAGFFFGAWARTTSLLLKAHGDIEKMSLTN